MGKKEHYDAMTKALLARIHNWDDFYSLLDSQMELVRGTMHPISIMDTLFTMYAFFCVMRENPEESDIVELVKKMAHMLVYDSAEKLGVDLAIVSMAQAAELVAAAAAAGEALSEDGKTPARLLH